MAAATPTVDPDRTLRSLRSGALVLAAGATLAGAGMLEPDARGYGTSEQLGIFDACPASRAHECPSCGLVTSVVHAVRGDLAMSARAHGAGIPLVLTLAWALLVGAATLVPRPFIGRRVRRSVTVLLTLATVAAGLVTAGQRAFQHTPVGALR